MFGLKRLGFRMLYRNEGGEMSKNKMKLIWFQWQPGRDLLALLVSWLLVVASLYTATVIVGQEVWGGMGYFLLYAVLSAGVFGVGMPLYWMVVVQKRSLADLGIKRNWLWLSLGLQVVFAGLQFAGTLGKGGLPALEQLAPLLTLALAIGFFEAVFWRGWVLLRLEEAFGLVPAILLGSLLYAAYHIGYGMPLSEMVFLFFIGMMYALAFRLTKNIFILWPVFQPMGQLVTLIKDGLELPLIASLGFVEVLIGMLVLVWLAGRYAQKRTLSAG
jgi:membrane protease YdiL (CAAX protease family)